jgi:hypothetical protein
MKFYLGKGLLTVIFSPMVLGPNAVFGPFLVSGNFIYLDKTNFKTFQTDTAAQ